MMQHLYLRLVGSIRQRALWLALLPAVLVATALASYFSITGMGELDEELRRRGHTIVQYLAPASEYGLISGNRPSLQALVQAAMQQPDVRAAVVTDFQGRVLAISGRTQLPVRLAEQAGDLVGLLASSHDTLGFVAPVRRSQLDIDDFLSLEPMPPQPPGSDRLGWVYVELSSEDLQARKSALLLHTLLILTAGLGAGAYVALRMARSLSRPVGRLLKAVGRMAAGELEARVEQASAGELGALERGFNHMASRLQDMHESMQERIATATAQLAHQASHDPLTGLANRREFELHLQATLDGRGGEELHHVLCYIDLDRFKVVNDTCGHAAGDELLRQITQLLRQRVRGQDLLARLGGDEFGLLLERCSLEDGLRVVESLRQLVEDFRFVWNNRAFGIGASIGLVELDSRIQTLEEALAAADQACFAAKDLGRNRIHVYQADDREVVQHQGEMDWASRLTQAVEENRLLLYAQPVVPLVSGISSCLRFEVFLRLLNERGEVVLPEVFLPAAERFNLMPRLDRWAIDAACSGLRRLLDQESHPSLQCGINLSVQTVGRPETLEYIGERLQHYDIAPACLCFEVAEAAASRQFAEVQTFAQGLRQLGCGFAFDAFGSGLSSFAYLRALPPDYVKIDGDLIHRMTDDRVSQTLVRAIHDISRQLGVAAVAEMVDDAAVFAMVREIGIELGQGTWFDPPQLFEDWLAVCEARHVNGEAGVYSILPSPAA